jgi:hypothetical protein
MLTLPPYRGDTSINFFLEGKSPLIPLYKRGRGKKGFSPFHLRAAGGKRFKTGWGLRDVKR